MEEKILLKSNFIAFEFGCTFRHIMWQQGVACFTGWKEKHVLWLVLNLSPKFSDVPCNGRGNNQPFSLLTWCMYNL